jgi:hypothetical protein
MKKLTAFAFALLCLLAVQCSAQYTIPPAMMGVSPYNGTGSVWNGYITGWDYYGGNEIQYLILKFGGAGDVNVCEVIWQPSNNYVGLLNDSGTQWNMVPSAATHCLRIASGAATSGGLSSMISGNYATGYANITLKPAFAGAQPMQGIVYAVHNGLNSGWIPANTSAPPGTWTVPGNTPATNITITPTSSTSITQSFTTQFTDPAGTANVDYVQPRLGEWDGCVPLVYPRWNALFLLNDARDGWGTAATIGSNTVLENSKCKVNANATFVQIINSTTMAVIVSATAKVSPMGTGVTSVMINGLNGMNTGLVNKGTWTVPTMQTTKADAISTHAEDTDHPAMGTDPLPEPSCRCLLPGSPWLSSIYRRPPGRIPQS